MNDRKPSTSTNRAGRHGRAKKLLLIDLGNTQMVFGLYHGRSLISHWRLSSDRRWTPDELAWQLHGMFSQSGQTASDIDGILAASVTPHLDATLIAACERVCGRSPAFVGSPEIKTGMAVDYKNPREVGADRIVNAIAAREQFGAPVIVLDCGTATTFDVVSSAGRYAGGLILPGIEVALEALCQRAAKLPEVSLKRPASLICRDTVSSMQAGSYWSAVDGIAGIIKRLRAEPGYAEAPVVATGGLASLIIEDIPAIDHHQPHLTLNGLLLLAERHF